MLNYYDRDIVINYYFQIILYPTLLIRNNKINMKKTRKKYDEPVLQILILAI